MKPNEKRELLIDFLNGGQKIKVHSDLDKAEKMAFSMSRLELSILHASFYGEIPEAKELDENYTLEWWSFIVCWCVKKYGEPRSEEGKFNDTHFLDKIGSGLTIADKRHYRKHWKAVYREAIEQGILDEPRLSKAIENYISVKHG